jgi:hypothetical protein
VEMLIFSMSRLKIRMAACNIWSSLQESATVDISGLISDVFSVTCIVYESNAFVPYEIYLLVA